ncbi:MAG: hypothetical protein JWR47_2721 [Phenylobacterium sp.]|jgi:hypothetical protein|uniref:hypothetical protein n=1 Tax=Phenylobacterium sp. TaxID=1871053 RepID=UPI0026181E4C|nr:hypothetical protein [Phenylobacterium sp.]MDB5436464.1 hypothetical protein [Phenylobacterium sp.]MDB5463258.1 hypothetical protein [Phenylobacterium sp.]MDB5496247.1 hypothetical protein [Phenylobacterium sp.]
MGIIHILNIADYFFMAVGVGVALLMIAMGGVDERRQSDRESTPEPPAKVDAPTGRARRR